MAIWPFNRKRRASLKDAASQPWANQRQLAEPPRSATEPPPTLTPPIPRRSSKRASQRKRRASPREKPANAQHSEGKKRQPSAGKENRVPRRTSSIEDITALPVSRQLDLSPHLRPVDLDRAPPPIPYNFRQHSTSQTSVQRQEVMSVKTSRPQTVRSRRSAHDTGSLLRKRSSKKRQPDHVREEEIRQMSAPIPIPKRPGEGPLRRDSKKLRSLGGRDSNVSLPREGSIHSAMSGILEQRGWEVGSLAIFNPRPAVRLSGTPQGVASPGSPVPHLTRAMSQTPKDKGKTPIRQDIITSRQTIAEEADDLGASDLRLLLERDAKRREQRKKDQHEKIDRKLRSAAGRERRNSSRRRREAEEARKATEAEETRRLAETRQRLEEQHRARGLITPPTDVHPALRARAVEPGAEDERDAEADTFGLPSGDGLLVKRIDQGHADVSPLLTPELREIENTDTYLNHPAGGDGPEDPFRDAMAESAMEPDDEQSGVNAGIVSLPETPMEDPIVETAQAVRMAHANTTTPPHSPARITDAAPSTSMDARTGSLPGAPLLNDSSERRPSELRERRTSGWAALFRRGGTISKRPRDASPQASSFSNPSRESMRGQPIPQHLVDTMQSPAQQSKTGTPMRAQSKFREDLPELPISPPESRTQSPDVTNVAAAAAASARIAARSSKPVDIAQSAPGARESDVEPSGTSMGRHDTPVSPLRGHGLMSASMASVDSEASWLAGPSTKRQSTQSGLSRSMGSLSKRKPEFTSSYEELGGDKDVDDVQRMSGVSDISTNVPQQSLKPGTSTLHGATPDEESELSESVTPEPQDDPMTVHESARRQPTLVHRDPRVKSREGLLTILTDTGRGHTPESPAGNRTDSDFEPDSPVTQVQSATSIDYSRGHAKQISSGSAKLLDMPRRSSNILESPVSPISAVIPRSMPRTEE